MSDEPSGGAGGSGFTDREMRLIFERAGELGAESAADRRFSLTELQAMGVQAGLDAADIAKAAASVRVIPPERRWLGAPSRFQWTFDVSGRLSDTRINDLVSKIRDTTGYHGELRVVPGGVEWQVRTALASFNVDFAPRGAGTRVGVRLAPSDHMALIVVGGGGLGVVVGIFSAIAAAEVDVPILIALAAGAAAAVTTAWGTARFLWSRAADRWQARGRAIQEAITAAAAEAPAETDHSPE